MQHLKIKVYDYNEVVACDAIQIKLDYLKVITCHNLFFLKAENAKFTDGEVEKPLKEGIYFLKKKDTFYEIMIYVYKMSCEHFEFYENQLVFIGNHPKANVIPDIENGMGYHIFIRNQRIISDFKYVYLNGKRYRNELLNDNDVIEIFSLKIIYFHEFLFINNGYKKCLLQVFDKTKHHFEITPNIKNRRVSHYLKKSYHLPVMEYHLKLEEYHKTYQKSSFITSVLQSIIMSAGMIIVALINIYIGYRNHREMIEMLPTILMPFVMMISSLSFPLISRHMNIKKDRIEKGKTDYNNTLIIDNLERKIGDDYKKCDLFYRHLSVSDDDLRIMLENGKVYYLEDDDDDYLKVAIGTGDIDSNITIIDDNGINHERLKQLSDKYKCYKNVPICLDLKKYHYISIQTDKDNLFKCFESFLLRLVISHKDLRLALLLTREFYDHRPYLRNIVHLFKDDKRYITFSEDDLKQYENYLILSLKRIDTDVALNNHIVCFMTDGNYGRKSEVLVKIQGDKGQIIESENITEFMSSYILNDFSKYYDELNIFNLTDRKNTTVTLNDLYSDINIDNIYSKHSENLKAVFGIDASGRRIMEDIEETGLGPHFLIGGSTGSGKSEFIISLIMSLSLFYRADHLNFTLIDYKGNGLSDSLSYNGKLLKHITLSLSNTDKNKLDRAIIALNKECERREAAFAKMSSIVQRSVMNIKEYHSLYEKRYNLPNLPFEIIVIDEFAELKNDRPDFMNDIISIARIGRSLGISLILLTQKPSLAVDEEIWSNVKTKIALKVQSPSDSKELIGTSDAYYIKRPGEFYMTYNGGLIHGYSPFSRAYMDEKNEAKAMVIDYDGRVIFDRKYRSPHLERQIENYISLINSYHEMRDIEISSIYLLPLKRKSIKELEVNDEHSFVIGEFDDYLNLKQGVLTHDFDTDNVILSYYQSVDERDNFIKLIMHYLSRNKDRYDYMLYLTAKKNQLNNIIECIDYSNIEDTRYVIDEIIAMRYKTFIIIDDYEMFIQSEEIKTDFEMMLTNIYHGNIHMVINLRLSSIFPYKYRTVFKKYLLGISMKDDITGIFNHYNPVSENNVCMLRDDFLVGFLMAYVNDTKKNPICERKLLKTIPLKIVLKKNMLGYDVMTREPLNVSEHHILVTGYDYDEVIRYKQLQINNPIFEFKRYREVSEFNEYDSYIWIGSGLTNQYLFIPRISKKLKSNEAYYVKGDIHRIVRYA